MTDRTTGVGRSPRGEWGIGFPAVVCPLALLVVLVTAPSHADDYTWDGEFNSGWGYVEPGSFGFFDRTNWTPDLPSAHIPDSDDRVIFEGTATGPERRNVVLGGTRIVQSAVFTGIPGVGGAGFTLSGGTLGLTTGDLTVSGIGTHAITGSVSAQGAAEWDVGSTAQLSVGGVGSTWLPSFTKTGFGPLSFIDETTFSTDFLVSEGPVSLSGASARLATTSGDLTIGGASELPATLTVEDDATILWSQTGALSVSATGSFLASNGATVTNSAGEATRVTQAGATGGSLVSDNVVSFDDAIGRFDGGAGSSANVGEPGDGGAGGAATLNAGSLVLSSSAEFSFDGGDGGEDAFGPTIGPGGLDLAGRGGVGGSLDAQSTAIEVRGLATLLSLNGGAGGDQELTDASARGGTGGRGGTFAITSGTVLVEDSAALELVGGVGGGVGGTGADAGEGGEGGHATLATDTTIQGAARLDLSGGVGGAVGNGLAAGNGGLGGAGGELTHSGGTLGIAGSAAVLLAGGRGGFSIGPRSGDGGLGGRATITSTLSLDTAATLDLSGGEGGDNINFIGGDGGDGGRLEINSGALTVAGGAAFRLEGGQGGASRFDSGNGGNGGALVLDGGDLQLTDGVVSLVGGAAGPRIQLFGGFVPGLPGDPGAVEVNDGLLHMTGGALLAASVAVAAPGQFDFDGGQLTIEQFDGQLDQDGGVLAPGDFDGVGTGDTSITGDYALAAGAEVAFDLAGTDPGAEHDTVHVGGMAALAGTLEVVLRGGFTPALGDQFLILEAIGGLDVLSATLNFPDLSWSGLGWEVALTPTTLTLAPTPALPGDFNLDGVVDAADYAVWRDGSGTIFNQADYTVWTAHYGETSSPTYAVPEPTLTGLLASGLLAGLRRRGLMIITHRSTEVDPRTRLGPPV